MVPTPANKPPSPGEMSLCEHMALPLLLLPTANSKYRIPVTVRVCAAILAAKIKKSLEFLEQQIKQVNALCYLAARARCWLFVV